MTRHNFICADQGRSTAEASDWRDWVKEQTKDFAECLDPVRRNYSTEYGQMPWRVVKEIVELDKIDIRESNVLLANMLPDKTKTGSNMEIIHAWTWQVGCDRVA